MALGHEGHGPNHFSSLCRACRMGGDLERIREIGTGVSEREELRREVRADAKDRASHHLWTAGQLLAMRAANFAEVPFFEFIEWCAASRGEVTGRG